MKATHQSDWQTLLAAAGFADDALARWTKTLTDAGDRATRAAILRPYDGAVSACSPQVQQTWQQHTAHLTRTPFSFIALRDVFPAIVYAASLIHPGVEPVDAMRRVMNDELEAFQQLPFVVTVMRALDSNFPMLLEAMSLMFRLESDHGRADLDFIAPNHAVLRYEDVVADVVAIYVPTYVGAVGRQLGVEPRFEPRVLDERTFELEIEWD